MKDIFSTIILSSGLSERMRSPKALLKWDSETTFIEKVIQEYVQAGSEKIICMINPTIEQVCGNLNIPQNVHFIVNEHPEWGRFYSIKTGLSKVGQSPFCFIQNVDNPFVNEEIIRTILSLKKSDSWCSPVFNGKGGHPVLLPDFIIQKITGTSDLNMSLKELLSDYKKIKVEMSNDLIHRNINTPEDYTKFMNSDLLPLQ